MIYDLRRGERLPDPHDFIDPDDTDLLGAEHIGDVLGKGGMCSMQYIRAGLENLLMGSEGSKESTLAYFINILGVGRYTITHLLVDNYESIGATDKQLETAIGFVEGVDPDEEAIDETEEIKSMV